MVSNKKFVFGSMWQRYFFYEALKASLLTLFLFIILFISVDYSSHAKLFHGTKAGQSSALLFYASQICVILPKLLPFCLLIGCLKVLLGANSRHETIALFSAGLSKRKLLKPFIALWLGAIMLLYLNQEFISLKAFHYISKTEEAYAQKRRKSKYIEGIETLPLRDGSTLLFRGYDKKNNFLLEALWVRSIDDIWRIGKFPLNGGYIDSEELANYHFVRDETGKLTLDHQLQNIFVDKVVWDDPNVWAVLTDPQELPISVLWSRFPPKIEGDKEILIALAFYYNSAVPWLGLLILCIVAPYCFTAARNTQSFLIIGLALFGLVILFIALDTSMLLAKNRLVSALFAVAGPLLVASFLAVRQLAKLNR